VHSIAQHSKILRNTYMISRRSAANVMEKHIHPVNSIEMGKRKQSSIQDFIKFLVHIGF
jgi:hypothetical protein